MAASKYSFTIEQGATTNISLTWTDSNGDPIDLSGYQARMQLRPSVSSDDVYLTLSSSLSDICGTMGTGIVMSGSDGQTDLISGSMAIYISAVSSSQLDFDIAYYDLELEKDCEVTRLIEGQVRLSKEVTR